MKFTILTLFPELISNYFDGSILKNAIAKKIIDVELVNFRSFSTDSNLNVDDYQYGGGPGMVIKLQPIVDCLKKYRQKNSIVILLSASGQLYNSHTAFKLSKMTDHIILICGHYEGIDERIINYVDYEIAIGDYVLSGGEIASLVLIDSISRFLPNVIKKESLDVESFGLDFLLDYPVYTRPEKFDNYFVPEVLLSGNHQLIKNYRDEQRILKTKKNRKDLYQKYQNNLNKKIF